MKTLPIVSTIKQSKQSGLQIHIRKYSDGRFGFDWKAAGERKKVRLDSQKIAEDRAKQYLGEGKAGLLDLVSVSRKEFAEFLMWKASRKPDAYVPDLVDRFIESKTKSGKTTATIRELGSTLNKFKEKFPLSISEITRSAVEAWLDSSEKKRSPRRWNNMRAAICGLYRFARNDGLLPAELTPVERMSRRAVRVHVETYTFEEMQALIDAVPREWLPLIVLGGFCGLRPEEISPDPRNGGWKPALRWENINWKKQKIDVPETVSKVRRRRFAILTDAAVAFLDDWKSAQGPIVPPLDAQRVKRGWIGDLSWKKNGLRHSYASYRLALTKDAPALALEMGNSPSMIFRHYLDLKHEDEAERWFSIRPKCQKFHLGPPVEHSESQLCTSI